MDPSSTKNKNTKSTHSIIRFFKYYFYLRKDKENELETIANIRAGVEFKGASLWILIFAILIASLGLNVNSTAVIIGAMLISPLMGPIIGMGLALGINDYELLKKSMRSYLIATLLVVLVSIIPILHITVNPDLESYLDTSMPSRENNLKINEIFGNEELLLVVFQTSDVLQENTLNRISQIAEAFSDMPEFNRVYSLFQGKDIRSEDGSMVVNPVVETIPVTENERDALRESIRSNDLVYKVVISEDFKNAIIILGADKTVQDDYQLALVKETLEQYPGDEITYITGNPYLT
jgi:hypothetical protein